MRLLKCNSDSEINPTENLHDSEVPPYTILSHTWAADSDEVTLVDLQTGQAQSKAGCEKIRFCAEQTRKDGFGYVWVDTCCINKTDSVELSEAIISMFRWYRDAERCYVYLADVSANLSDGETGAQLSWEPSFRASRWFKRGWTLQELLAPKDVRFFSRDGVFLGTKHTLAQQIHEITTIPLAALYGTPPSQFPISERLRWTQGRQTRKKEDKAYCLLGIFGVYMPLLYGEGNNAFHRLEQVINNRSGVDTAAATSSRKVPDFAPASTSATNVHSSYNLGNQTLELYRKRVPRLKLRDEESLYESFRHYKYERVYQLQVLAKCKNTGNWIEGHNMYQSWRSCSSDGEHCVLWLSGEKGCGKTITASSVIAGAHAKLQTQTNPNVVVLYSLYDDQHNNTSNSVLCVIIHQLVTQLPELKTVLYDRYRSISPAVSKHYQRPTAQLGWVLQELLRHAVQVKTMYIVLDGLDFLTRDSQYGILKELKHGPSSIKYLISGRNMSDVKTHFASLFQGQRLLNFEIDLRSDDDAILAVNRAIDTYTYTMLFNTQRYAFLSDSDKRSVFRSLRRYERATFLATRLFLDVIESKRGADPVLNIPLSRMPVSCDVIFVELFKELQSIYGVQLDVVFRYLFFGFELLTIDEIVYANDSLRGLSTDNVGSGMRQKLLQCHPLIEIRKRSQRINFCHPSAKQTLLQFINDTANQATYRLDQHACHQILAIECLRRLLQTGNFGLPESWRSEYMRKEKEAIDRHVLLRYALKWWYKHLHIGCSARLASNDVANGLREILRQLARFWSLQDEKSVTLRHLMIDLSGIQHLKYTHISGFFELSCALGLTGVVQEMLNSKIYSRRFKVRVAAALSAAIKGGHECLVQMLIEQFSVESLDGDAYADILQATVRCDRPELFNLVLKLRTRDMNELDNALSAAIQTANTDMFNRLRKEIDAQKESRPTATTALHAMFRDSGKRVEGAVLKETILKIQVLVRDGNVDVNTSEPVMGNTALHLACWFDFDAEIVSTLIDVGADLRKPNRFGWTPLHLAARYSRDGSTMTTLLRLGGAELAGLLTDGGNSPLHWAAEPGVPSTGGRFGAVTRLLDAGADPNLLNDKGVSPKALLPSLAEVPRRIELSYIRTIKARDAFQSAYKIGAGARNSQTLDCSSSSELDLESRRELNGALSNLPYMDSDPDFEGTINE